MAKKMKKRIVSCREYYGTLYEFDGRKLDSLVGQTFQSLIEQYGPDARIDIDDDEIYLVFERLETDNEFKKRCKSVEKQRELQKKEKEKKKKEEYELYLELHKEYGSEL